MIAPSCCWPDGRAVGALVAWISLAAASIVSQPALAQGSKADYERAQSLAQRTENKVFRARVRPEWFNPSNFWYRVETGPGLFEFVRVNATTGGREPLMDLGRLRAAVGHAPGTAAPDAGVVPESIQVDADGAHARLRLAGRRWRLRLADHALVPDEQPEAPLPASQGRVPRRSRRTGDETSITFVNQTRDDAELFWLDPEGQRRSYGRLRPGQERSQHTFEGHAWLVTDKLGNTLAVFEADATGRRAVIEEGKPVPPASPAQAADVPSKNTTPRRPPERGQSPNGRWVAFVQDHNLHLRPADGGPAVALSRDGNATNAYSPDVSWAPDSSAVVARRVRKGGERTVHMVEAAPKEIGRAHV